MKERTISRPYSGCQGIPEICTVYHPQFFQWAVVRDHAPSHPARHMLSAPFVPRRGLPVKATFRHLGSLPVYVLHRKYYTVRLLKKYSRASVDHASSINILTKSIDQATHHISLPNHLRMMQTFGVLANVLNRTLLARRSARGLDCASWTYRRS